MSDLPAHHGQGWWAIEDLGEGVIRLHEPAVHRMFRANVFLVTGREWDLVIDAGMGLRPLRPVLEALTPRPLRLVATHGHCDHVGDWHAFDHRAVHGVEAAALAIADPALTLAAWFASVDAPVTELPAAGWRVTDWTIRAAPATHTLGDGDVLDLGTRRLQVLHLPGHSPGSIALWDDAAGVLFGGDVIYDGQLVDTLPHSDAGAYASSFRRLLALPVRRLHGGHNAACDGDRMRALIQGWFDARR